MFASLAYNGYGRFDTDEFCSWIGETGRPRDAIAYGAARQRLRTVRPGAEEAALKNRRAYGAETGLAEILAPPPPAYNHFGLVIVSCEGGDLRPTPNGVMIYADEERRFEALPPPAIARAEVIDELVAVLRHGQTPLHSGAWGLATMEICLAMLASGNEHREVELLHQVGLRG